MKSIKIFLVVLLTCGILWAKDSEKITLNFNNTPVEDVIKFVAKALDKNILIKERLSGNVNFISTKPINSDELLPFLRNVLESKGFTVSQNESGYLEIIKANQAKSNSTLFDTKASMMTNTIKIKNVKASTLINQVKHLANPNGIISANDIKNEIFIVDYSLNIQKIKKLIETLDYTTITTNVFVTLENHFAADSFKHIETIFTTMTNEFRMPVKLLLLNQSNSILAICDKRDEQKVRNTIEQFDIKNPKLSIYTDVIPVNNAKATELFKVLDIMIKSLKTETGMAIAAKEDINAIAVTGNKSQIEMVKSIVNKLDKEKKQIYLATKVYEISKTNLDNLGIKWGLTGGAATNTGIFTSIFNMGGSYFTLADELADKIDVDTTDKGIAVGAIFDLLKTNGVVNTLSEPSLIAVNNIKSNIYVGKTKSILTSSATGDNVGDVTRNSYTREDIGLSLEVTPQIADDDKVVLDLAIEIEDIDSSDAQVVDRPTTTKREIKTSSIVIDGQSVIVGGLMKDYYSKTNTKVPFFGDIPFIGKLFRSSSETFDKINLVVVVTPYIINSSDEIEAVQSKITKLNLVQQDLSKKIEEQIKKIIKEKNDEK